MESERTILFDPHAQTEPAIAERQFLAPSPAPDCLGRLGTYDVLSIIGRGGMGVVFRARDTRLNRIVAVKVLAAELAANPVARKRFLREAQAAAAVTHPHVVTIHAVDEDKIPYLVMEMVEGQSLQDKIRSEGALGVGDILRIGSQIASGLAAAHQQGLMHRDIKPANILLETGTGRVKITDFGLARGVDDLSMTRTGEVAGTPQYMAPEQIQEGPVDQRADLFSLGSVLYCLCTGQPPFRGETMIAVVRRVCEDVPLPIRDLNPQIPDWLCEIVNKLLQKRPEDRYQTAGEVSELLSEHLAHLQHPSQIELPQTVAALPPVVGTDSTASRRSSRWLMRGSLLLVALLLGGLGYQHVRQPSVKNDITSVPPGMILIPPGGTAEIVSSGTGGVPGPPQVMDAPLSLGELLTSPNFEWSTPENLGPGVNSGKRNLCGSLTADERVLVFARDGQLCLSRRASVQDRFEQAEPLPEAINRQVRESVSISGDGLLLAINSTRPGSALEDVWLSTRTSVDEPFGEPVRLPEPVNSATWEREPVLSSDGLTLLLVSFRRGGPGNGDIVMFSRKSRQDPFGQETMLAAPVNTPFFDVPAWLSDDGRVLVTSKMDKPPFETRLSVRSAQNVPFGPPLPLEAPFDQVHIGRPWLSPDGQRMYFHTRDLQGGHGDLDLWLTRRIKKSTTSSVRPIASH